MSEVNQAFLRAYLKNRAAQSADSTAAPVATDPRVQANANMARPSAAAPRQPSLPPTQPSQSLPSGMNLRFDPSHSVDSATSSKPTNADPMQPRAIPRQGVWSPLGVERGMKSLEATSAPAIVRNGIEAVTRESSQYRRPTTGPLNQPPAAQQPRTIQEPVVTTPAVTSVNRQSAPHVPASAISYEQVQFVDGLDGHTASHRSHGTRPSERALAEITEPIAFGTGLQTSTPQAKRPKPITPPTSSAPPSFTISETAPEQASVSVSVSFPPKTREWKPAEPLPQPNQPTVQPNQSAPKPQFRETHSTTDKGVVSRRFDSAHQKSSVVHSATNFAAPKPPTISSPPPKAQPASSMNASLPLPVAFSPSWEVDLFHWPEVVKQIETSHADAFRQIGKHLSLANRDGLKVMAITSGERGVGRSTVAMHMARCAASSGLRVALIDGDTYCPSLIDQLRLDMQQGWQDCLFENVPLHEIAVHSLADNITLFPLTTVISQQQVHANLHRMAKLVRRIASAFDMVLIDANRLNLEQRDMMGVAQETVVDAAIVVVDTELSIKEKVDSAVSILQGMGISSIGLVENFQS